MTERPASGGHLIPTAQGSAEEAQTSEGVCPDLLLAYDRAIADGAKITLRRFLRLHERQQHRAQQPPVLTRLQGRNGSVNVDRQGDRIAGRIGGRSS